MGIYTTVSTHRKEIGAKMADAMGAGLGMLSGACFIWSIIYLCRLIDSAISGASKGVDEAKRKNETA